jgi:hypothetical protein
LITWADTLSCQKSERFTLLILSRQQSKAEELDCQFNNPQNH